MEAALEEGLGLVGVLVCEGVGGGEEEAVGEDGFEELLDVLGLDVASALEQGVGSGAAFECE